jgi:hypothetical protein
MMNLFDNATPETQGLFDGVITSEEAPVANPQDAGHTARLAAIGSLDINTQDLFATMQRTTEIYKQRAEMAGDASIRTEAAIRAHEEDTTAALSFMSQTQQPGFDPTGELQFGATKVAEAALNENIVRRERYALEEQALKRAEELAVAGHRTQAQVILKNLEYGSPDALKRDYLTKQMILANALDKVTQDNDERNWLLKLGDMVLSTVPFNTSSGATGNIDIPKSEQGMFDWVFSGKRKRQEASALWNIPTADLAEYIDKQLIPNMKDNSSWFGWENKSMQVDLLKGMVEPTPTEFETNAFNALDNVPLIGSVSYKSIKGLGSLALRMGGRTVKDNLISKVVLDATNEGLENAATKVGLNANDVVTDLSATGMAIGERTATISSGPNVLSRLERGRKLIDELGGFTETERLSPDEIERLQKNVERAFQGQHGDELLDVTWGSVDLAGGSKVRQVSLALGKKDGTGFATKGAAKARLTSLNKKGEVIQDESGMWYVSVKENIPETGFRTNELNVPEANWFSRKVLSAKAIGDNFLAGLAQVADNKRARVLTVVQNVHASKIRKLNNESRDIVSQVLSKGSNDERWYTPDEVDTLVQRAYGRPATVAEKEAVQAAQDINDIEYALRNDEVWKKKAIRGLETVTSKLGSRINAKINENMELVPKGRATVLDTGESFSAKKPLTAERVAELKSEGYVLVTTEQPFTHNGIKSRDFFIKKGDMTRETLRRDQVGYRAGGHRMYEGMYFIRQAVKGVQQDGQEFLANPKTYLVTMTPAEAKFFAGRMEAARQAVKNGGGVDEVEEIFGGHAGFESPEDFIKNLKDGTYEMDHAFEVNYDRELPALYSEKNDALDFLVDAEETSYEGYMRTVGKMYESGRGKQLHDYYGALAPTLDPYQTIDASIRNIANITSLSDYRLTAIQRWLETYGKRLTTVVDDPTNVERFIEASFNKDTPYAYVQSAEAQREVIKRNLGWQTEYDLQANQLQRKFTDFVNGDNPNGLRNSLVASDWWAAKNPVASLRGFAFDMKLGFFNVAQFPLQIQTAVAATTMSPKFGMQGFAMGPTLRHFLRSKTDEAELVNLWRERKVHELGGFDSVEELHAFAKSAKQSGFFNLNNLHSLIGEYGPSSVAGAGILRSDGALRTAGRFFFNEGEMANRAVAWRIAWGEAKTQGIKDVMSPEFQRLVASRAEDYSFRMSRTSTAAWQQGALSIPTQFWAYNMRMMEAMLGSSFTREQRLRLVLGQTFLYGSAGLPVAGYLTGLGKEAAGDAPKFEGEGAGSAALAMLDRGLYDTALYYLTGADVLVGKRMGTGGFLEDRAQEFLPTKMKELLHMSGFGSEKNFGDMMGGATTSIMFDTTGTLFNIIKHGFAESGGDLGQPLLKDDMIRAASNISTMGNLAKAYFVFKYGTYKTNKGSTPVSGLDQGLSVEALATLLSFQPGEMDSIEAMMSKTTNRTKLVKEIAKEVGNLRTRMVNEPDNREELAKSVQFLMQNIDPDIREAVRRKLYDDPDPSLYISLAEQKKKREAEQQRIEDVNGKSN